MPITDLTTAPTVPLIIDTDLSGDVDDVGALAVAARLHNESACNLLAVGSCVWNSYSVGAINAILTFYGLGGIPVGKQWNGANALGTETTGYAKHVSDNFSHTQDSSNVSSAVDVYREKLAAADDGSVVFVTIGPLHNVQALLNSPGDGYSALNGTDLFNQKVARMHTMGGEYPSGGPEWNFSVGGAGVTADVFNRVTVPVYFNGHEVGWFGGGWGAGAALDAENTSTNPVAAAYWYWFKYPESWVNGGVSQDNIDDWSTWDPIAVYTAIMGRGHFGEVSTGSNVIQSGGSNAWASTPDKNQTYLTANTAPATFAKNVLEPLFLPS